MQAQPGPGACTSHKLGRLSDNDSLADAAITSQLHSHAEGLAEPLQGCARARE